jgi:hypothetical protein
MELPGVWSRDEVLAIVREAVRFYKERSTGGRRFAHLLEPGDLERFVLPKKET